MRTITKSNMKRLIAQRDEAKTLGLTKIASNLTNQISSNPVREATDDYTYNYDDLQLEVEAQLWDSAIRTQDFYAKFIDAREIQDLIEKHAEDFIKAIRIKAGSVIGAYEQPVIGEAQGATIIDIEDE